MKRNIFIIDTFVFCHNYFALKLAIIQTLNINQFFIDLCIINTMDVPLCSIAYVQKGYTVNKLVDIWC